MHINSCNQAMSLHCIAQPLVLARVISARLRLLLSFPDSSICVHGQLRNFFWLVIAADRIRTDCDLVFFKLCLPVCHTNFKP